MTNVINFPGNNDDEIVYVCDCGNMSFYIHEDGAIECTGCKKFATEHTDNAEWVKQLKPVPDKVTNTDVGKTLTHSTGSVDLAKRIVTNYIQENDELFIIMSFTNSESGKHWMGIFNQEDKEKAIRLTESFLEVLKRTEP